MKPFLLALVLVLLTGCAEKVVQQKAGSRGSRPYTVLGKTYYPLKSAHGFLEEGLASWYGLGFHGKNTASGEKYNQYAMTAAHKILPLGTDVRVTNLGNGRSVLVRVNDRGPFAENRIIDLSKAAATRLDIIGSGTAKVRVQSLGDIPEIGKYGDIKGDFYIQAGAFANRENASRLINELIKEKYRGRLVFGSNNMWNVQIGPWKDSETAQKILLTVRETYPHAFVVGGN